MKYDLYHGDCLDVLPTLPENSVDAVITDLPYGTTACKWDSVIPFEPMWEQVCRVVRVNGAVVFFGKQPFTSLLVVSNLDWFKYELVLKKGRAANFLQASVMPLMYHENIVVFSGGTINHLSAEDRRMRYFPQMEKGTPYTKIERHGGASGITESASLESGYVKTNPGTRYPGSILECKSSNADSPHPTAKQVETIAYLIRTYTLPGDTVLDFTMGSGTTGVACVETERNFVGVEILKDYFVKARHRIEQAVAANGQRALVTTMLKGSVEEHEVEPAHMQAPLMQLLKEMEGEDR